jgi:hypothetical protein
MPAYGAKRLNEGTNVRPGSRRAKREISRGAESHRLLLSQAESGELKRRELTLISVKDRLALLRECSECLHAVLTHLHALFLAQ